MEAFELRRGFSPLLFIMRSLKYSPFTMLFEQNSGTVAEII